MAGSVEEGGRPTYGIGNLAHGIVAHIEVAEASAFDEAGGEGGEEIVGEGEPGMSTLVV